MPVDVVLGLQRGDEGKGRIVDLLSEEYDVVARFNGGPNAGHTLSHNGESLALHQIPSGIRNPDTLNIIGNGALVDLVRLEDEVNQVRQVGISVSAENLRISDAAHLILPHHVIMDAIRESSKSRQGSTVRGIAFAASDKYERSGIRADALSDIASMSTHLLTRYAKIDPVDLNNVNNALRDSGQPAYNVDALHARVMQSATLFAPYVCDTVTLLHSRLATGKRVLAEGAQAAGLDIELSAYPFGSSSHSSVGGALNGLGFGPKHVGEVFGVIKAIKSHVGDGPFVTEIINQRQAARIRGKKDAIDGEYGKSTGRPRRVGHLDLPELRRAVEANGVSRLVLNKLDVLPNSYGSVAKIAVAYELDGSHIESSPGSLSALERCKPVYEEIPLWDSDISDVRTFAELPEKARSYLAFIADSLGVEIAVVGVGPHKDQVITQ